VNQFIDMMELRISSLFALASSIFMRRIRRLVYRSVMGDDLFKGKTVPTLIYNLMEADTFQGPLEWLNPSRAACEVASAADKLPTTLWFTAPDQLPHLIACGQMTICRKLLLHILKLGGDDPDAIPHHLRPLFDRARALFEKLNCKPHALAKGGFCAPAA
jgi:hypothetical protein